MVALKPYLLLPGFAREALEFYQGVFGGTVDVHSFVEFGRDDGPPDAVAHGILDGPVPMYAADAGNTEEPLRVTGMFFSLLGAAPPATLQAWFEDLAEGGTVVEPLAVRDWSAVDGQVRDRFGLAWLIGWELGGRAAAPCPPSPGTVRGRP